MQIQPCQLRKWQRNKVKLIGTPKNKKLLGRGKKSSIAHLEPQIIGWVLDQRALGIPLTYKVLQVKISQMDQNFAARTERQQYRLVRSLCHNNKIVIRCCTHTAQRRPEDVIDQALEFLRIERPVVSAPGVNRDLLINMDQTPVFLSMHPNRTLNLRGETTINRRITASSTSRVTVSLGISASGKKLKPMMIFKWASSGRIVTKELPAFPEANEVKLVCHPAAWQDDSNMIEWIDSCLVPYLQEHGRGANAILYLDSFSVHQSASTKEKLQEIGVEARILPAGCTSLLQAVDVGIGKPFKDRIWKKWFDWMMEQDPEQTVMTNASRADCASWVAQTWRELPEEIIRNSWLKDGLSWFPVVVQNEI